jgi:hypothetical protein
MTDRPGDPHLFELLERFEAGERSEAVFQGATGFASILQGSGSGRMDRRTLERELRASRREELAALLRHACYRTLQAAPREKSLLVATREADGRLWVEPTSQWNARAAALEIDRQHLDANATAMIRSARDRGFDGRITASSLALAALRVQDGWKARIYLSQALAQEGDERQSLQVAEDLLAQTVSHGPRGHSLSAVASAQARLGMLEGALASYRVAAEHAVVPVVCEFSWLTLALRMGRADEAIEAGSRLSELCSRTDDVLDCIHVWRAARGLRALGALSQADEVRRMVGRLPPVAREIMEVALE